MKKLKISLLALVFAVGVGGAFVQKIQAAPAKFDQLYSWKHYDTDGTTLLETVNGLSITQAQSQFGCNSNATRCAVGTANGQETQTLRYPQ